MKRFKVQTKDGYTLRLYYPSLEEAMAHNPEAVVSWITDQSYMESINKMIQSANRHQTAERRGSTVHLLSFDTPAGTCLAWLFQDMTDGVFYDYCEYQLWKIGRLVNPVTKTMGNPAEFCEKFLFSKPEYTVLCMGRRDQVKKPSVLSGIEKFASIPFIPEKCTCQLFLNGDDLYIKHMDYFSPEYRRPEDNGTPLLCRLKKYNIPTKKKEQFVYADCWGAIVMRRVAWIKVSNFVPLVKQLDATGVAATVWPLLCKYHGWSEDEHNMEWEQFLEATAKATQRYLAEMEAVV